MDIEQEQLQCLGFFGILKHSTKIILSWRKIFTQITLTLILPISFIFLAHIQVSQSLLDKIQDHEDTINQTQTNSTTHSNLSHIITSEWVYFSLFKVAYFTILLILSLLSTAAVVYTVASIYTSRPVTFKRVISVVPRVWKRLIVTFLWSFGIVFVYNIVAVAAFCLWAIFDSGSVIGGVILIIFVVLYIVGLLCITIVWHIASVVSVLEDIYGIKALVKGKNLIKGKMGIAVAVFVMLGAFVVGIQFVFEVFVVFGWPLKLAIRIGIGFLCFLVLVKVVLFGLVIQTVLYFVCKSYHHESIDKSSLSDHLEAYHCEYVPLRKDVQMQNV